MLKVLCVLKSGGVYTPSYVNRLRNMVARHLSVPYEFKCLSDLRQYGGLIHNYHGWWSKIELFREHGPVIYFDLDTIIVGSINKLAEAVVESDHDFFTLQPFRQRLAARYGEYATAIMAWSGDWSWIYEQFNYKRCPIVHRKGDQSYISAQLREKKIAVKNVGDYLPKIYSYKLHCRHNELPKDAQIICFHGNPRIHAVKDKWIKEHWV